MRGRGERGTRRCGDDRWWLQRADTPEVRIAETPGGSSRRVGDGCKRCRVHATRVHDTRRARVSSFDVRVNGSARLGVRARYMLTLTCERVREISLDRVSRESSNGVRSHVVSSSTSRAFANSELTRSVPVRFAESVLASDRRRLPVGCVQVFAPETRKRSHVNRVVVVAPVRLYCDAIALGLASRGGCEIASCAYEAESAAGIVVDVAPDVVVIDGALPNATKLVRRIAGDTNANTATVALLGEPTALELIEWVSAGVSGALAREATLEDLSAAVRAAPNGEFPCSRSFVALLAQALRRVVGPGAASVLGGVVTGGAIDVDEQLTRREKEVLALVRAGMSNKEIAQRLFIDVSTVKNHVHNVLRKTGLERREQAGRLVAS